MRWSFGCSWCVPAHFNFFNCLISYFPIVSNFPLLPTTFIPLFQVVFPLVIGPMLAGLLEFCYWVKYFFSSHFKHFWPLSTMFSKGEKVVREGFCSSDSKQSKVTATNQKKNCSENKTLVRERFIKKEKRPNKC